MYRILRYIYIFIIFLYNTQFFQVILCDFEETSDDSSTSPSIEIKLSPPENPLPEISEEIHDSELTRAEIEGGLIDKLKDKFNEKLVESRDKIKECVEENFINNLKANNISIEYDDKHQLKHENQVSFLQINNNNKLKSDVVPSSVRVMMDDIEELDPAVNQKIKQIEELRNDSEIQLFDRAEREFDELLEITLVELEKNIKIQIDVLVTNLKHGHLSTDHHSTRVKSVLAKSKRVVNKPKKLFHNLKNRGNRFMNSFVPSFLQLFSNNVQQKLLNVKIGQPDKPYPTADDLVMNMEKRRDASENKIRNKILNMQMRYIMAHHEMAKDALHTITTKLISQIVRIHNRYI